MHFSWTYVWVAVTLVPSAISLVAITLYFRRVRSRLALVWLVSAGAAFAAFVASNLNALFFLTDVETAMFRSKVLGYIGLGLGMTASVSFLLVMMRLLARPGSSLELSPETEVPESV